MTATRGLFLTIEGIEGAGKSTLAEELGRRLSSGCRCAIVTREPGGGKIGDSIRELLLGCREQMSERAELLLFEAARAQHVDDVIRPALERGDIVICDRFADSSIAYQGIARGIGRLKVERLNQFATLGLKPDLTILLDLPANAGLARQRSLDRISSENLRFHESVREGYLAVARAEPERIRIIDATQSFELVVAEALEAVEYALAEVE